MVLNGSGSSGFVRVVMNIVEIKQLIDVQSLLNLILRSDSPRQEVFILEKVKFVTDRKITT